MEAPTVSGGETLTQKESVKSRRSVITPWQLQSNHALIVNPFLTLFVRRKILHLSVNCCLNTPPYHPTRYEVLIN